MNQKTNQANMWLLSTLGNILFTLIIGSLLWMQNVGAISLGLPLATTASITSISYQGRLADKNGAPLTQTVNMIFRLYASASGGSALWEEQWTGVNSVQVRDGLFNVMLGSLTPIPQGVITGNDNLFLGISVGTDGEMIPRVQLGSVPFATQALTLPDNSITTNKIQDGAITASKLASVTLTRARYHSLPPNWTFGPNDWSDMPGAAITQNFGAGEWKISFTGMLGVAVNNGTVYMRLQIRPTGGQSFEIANTTIYRSGWNLQSGANGTQSVVLQGVATLPAGEVTIVPQVWSNFSAGIADAVLIIEQ